MNSFDPLAINPVSGTPGVVTFAGVNGVPERAFATDKNNFGPRFGFAYRIPGTKRTRHPRRQRHLLWADRQQYHRRYGGAGIFDAASFVVAQADLQSAFRLRDGFPVTPRPALNRAFGAVPLGQKAEHVGLFLQSEAGRADLVSIQPESPAANSTRTCWLKLGYIGNVSHHLTANDFSLNQVPAATHGTRRRAGAPAVPAVQQCDVDQSVDRKFDVSRRVHPRGEAVQRSFSFLAHYTFSKFLDDVESANEYGATGSYMDAYNRALDKGLSGSDVPHHLVVTVLYEIPGFRGKSHLNAMLGGWKLGLLETSCLARRLPSSPPPTRPTHFPPVHCGRIFCAIRRCLRASGRSRAGSTRRHLPRRRHSRSAIRRDRSCEAHL